MSSVVTELIPDSPFQIIQNRIAEILFEELTAQHSLQNLDSDFEFFVERIHPYDTSEDVVVTIACKEQENFEYTQINSQATITYFVDIFTGGVESSSQSLAENVRLKLFKYVSMVKYILNSAKYQTLGFKNGLVRNRHIKKTTFDTDYSNWGNHSNYDGSGIRFCRLIYSVTTIENTEAWQGIPLQGNDSILMVGTDKGTQLKFNN